MKRTMTLAASAAVLLVTAGVTSPLKVRTAGGKSQQVIMCPNCKEKVTCAKVGDYTVGFDADLENSKLGTATVAVHLMDQSKKPVKDATVLVTLTMPIHKHQNEEPLTLKHTGHGRYVTSTHFMMTGSWRAAVEVTPAGGDTIKQAFVLTR